MIASPTPAKLVAFYLSRDRVLSLVDTAKLPLLHMQALQGAMCRCHERAMSCRAGSLRHSW